MQEILRNPHARWAAPLLAAVIGFTLCCLVMFMAQTALVYNLSGGDIPMGARAGWQWGYEMGQRYPLYGLFSLLVMILPCATLIVAPVAAFLLVSSYQKRRPPPPAV